MVNKARRKKETQLLGIHDQHIGQMMSSIRLDTAICHLFPHPSNLMCVNLCMFADVGACTRQGSCFGSETEDTPRYLGLIDILKMVYFFM